ncbi:MAG: metal ABC transporter solute-binding protein, Zn/Mn family [Phycisphaerales bacterium]
MNRLITISLSILPILLVSCGESVTEKKSSQEPQSVSKLTIVTTTGMITDPASRIAGDHARVSGLIGSGIDPHLYKPTRTDISKLSSADVVLYSGLMLEGRMTDAFVRIASSGVIVKPVTELISEDALLSPPEFEGHHDPHLWMDPTAWSQAVEVITNTLMEADPHNAATYRIRADAYQTKLSSLDSYADHVLSSVPESQRILITAHDAFNYFGQRYNYQVVGIQGISTESEAGVRDIERIVNLIVENKVRAVFVETTVSDRNINALIAGAKARGHEVIIGGSLYSDAMGEPGTYEGTYIGMMDHNATTIARALGGKAPPKGMSGSLSEELP